MEPPSMEKLPSEDTASSLRSANDATRFTPLEHRTRRKLLELTDVLLNQQRKMDLARNKLLDLRVQVDWEREKLLDCQRFFLQSQDAFVNTMCQDFTSRIALKKCQEQVVSDAHSLREQGEVTRALDDTVSNLEYRLMNRDTAFARNVQRLEIQLREGMPDLQVVDMAPAKTSRVSSPEHAPSQSERSSAPEPPPLLAEFYDKVGDARLLAEQLADMEVDHAEAAQVRGFRREQKRPLDDSDSVFEMQYQHARAEVEDQLGRTKCQADNLKRQCLDGGLDVSIPQRLAHRNNDTDTSNSHDDHTISPQPTSPIDGRFNKQLLAISSGYRTCDLRFQQVDIWRRGLVPTYPPPIPRVASAPPSLQRRNLGIPLHLSAAR